MKNDNYTSVVRLNKLGLDAAEISEELGISLPSVYRHLQTLQSTLAIVGAGSMIGGIDNVEEEIDVELEEDLEEDYPEVASSEEIKLKRRELDLQEKSFERESRVAERKVLKSIKTLISNIEVGSLSDEEVEDVIDHLEDALYISGQDPEDACLVKVLRAIRSESECDDPHLEPLVDKLKSTTRISDDVQFEEDGFRESKVIDRLEKYIRALQENAGTSVSKDTIGTLINLGRNAFMAIPEDNEYYQPLKEQLREVDDQLAGLFNKDWTFSFFGKILEIPEDSIETLESFLEQDEV